MHRQDSVNTSSEAVSIDQGSLHSNTDVSSPSLLDDMFSMVDDTRPSYTTTSVAPTNGLTHDAPPYNFWISGETSSRARSMFENGVKMDSGIPSYGVQAGCNSMSEERLVQEVDMLLPGRPNSVQGVNQLRNQPRFLQGYTSSSSGQSENLYESYMSRRGSYGPVIGPNVDSNFYRLGGVERERTSSAETFPGTTGCLSGSSSYMLVGDDDVSGPSVGNWGLSCKRKALEGTSGCSYSGGGSSNFQQIENSAMDSSITNNDASSSLSLSTPSQDYPRTTNNLNLGVGVTVSADCTNSNAQTNAGSRNESLPFSFPLTASSGYTLGNRNEPHRFFPFNDSSRQLAVGTTILSSPINRLSVSHSSPPRNCNPLPWNIRTNSSAANSSSSVSPAERAVVPRGEANRSIIPRHDLEHPMFAPVDGVRNAEHDPVGWILASGNINSSGSFTSSIRAGSSSSINSPIPWASSEPSPQNQQRQEEFASWSLFPAIDFESGARIDHFPPLSSGTSAQETVASTSSSRHENARQNRQSAYLLERQGDDAPVMPRSLRSLAADIEGRHRLISEIRHVLNAMRRGENIRLEDHVPFDPFSIHGVAEWHDQQRGMRLDVDNMSYEELLALGERIGDVSTGLSEDAITELMKQQKHVSAAAGSLPEAEPCSICQEEYSDGDELGRLNCGHDFHTDCIKQWLMQKNLCPICKETALAR